MAPPPSIIVDRTPEHNRVNIDILADGLVQKFYTADLWHFLFLVGGIHTRGKNGTVPFIENTDF